MPAVPGLGRPLIDALGSHPAVRRLVDGVSEPDATDRRTPIDVVTVELGELTGKPGSDTVSTAPAGASPHRVARRARVLVRDRGRMVGVADVPLRLGGLRVADVRRAVVEHLLHELVVARVRAALEQPLPATGLPLERVRDPSPPAPDDGPLPSASPSVSVVICSRDRTDGLARALDALRRQAGVHEIVVVDNAPSDARTGDLVRPMTDVRYVCEPRPGLDRARNRGLAVASGDVVAFTDDDAVVADGWVTAIARAFAADDDVHAVTGLVVPAELDTAAQERFERQGGFGRGCIRRWNHRDLTDPTDLGGRFLGAGTFGTGANMAFRRDRLLEIGGFDPALDVGTPTGGGGDVNAVFEVLHHGGTLVYEPDAVVAHHHRRTMGELRRQMAGNGGTLAHVSASVALDPRLAADARRLERWYVGYFARRLLRSVMIPNELPADHVLAEIRAHLGSAGGATLERSRTEGRCSGDAPMTRPRPRPPLTDPRDGIAVVRVDLARPLPSQLDTGGHARSRVHVTVEGAHVGRVEIANGGRPVPRARLLDEIARELGPDLVSTAPGTTRAERWWATVAAVRDTLTGADPDAAVTLPATTVSVVIATLDRPDDLRRCLAAVTAQRTRHQVEVVVVDNAPDSGETAAVVAEFADVVLVAEPRRGLSRARNAGVLASTGAIVVTTDDDVVVPEDWVERLVEPSSRDDVMAVCGNVLPLELTTQAQVAFEDMAMLGKGDEPKEVGAEWFAASVRHPARTWDLGATANAAFRREVFGDPAMGMFDTALGAGTPSGCSEDSYLLYRIVRAGYTVLYEPTCWVAHRHRTTDAALHAQLRAYYRGAVAHQLATVHHDGDLRGVVHIARVLVHQSRAAMVATLRRSPLQRHRRTELRGAVEGPWAYLQSLRQG